MIVWLADIFGVDLSFPQVATICSTCRPLSSIVVTSTTAEAVILALGGIGMLVLGTRVLEPRISTFRPMVTGFSPSGLFLGYLALLAVERISGPFVGGGLAQPIIAFGSLKFVFAILLFYLWITAYRGLVPLLGLIAIEVTLGLSGYFGDFKTIFIIVGVASVTISHLYWSRVRLPLLLAVPLLLLLASVWTVVKPTYRAYLNQGSKNQVVAVDVGESLRKFQELSENLDAGKLTDGILGAALRISYIEIPSYVLARVPDILPYENGALWGEAVHQVITPRFLYPDKPVLPSDSVRTIRYTGKLYSAIGTSVSMGYLIESYIDFGIFGALLIPFILGLVYGLMAQHIVYLGERYDPTFGVAILAVMFLPVHLFETSNIKLFPGLLWTWIICSFVVWGSMAAGSAVILHGGFANIIDILECELMRC